MSGESWYYMRVKVHTTNDGLSYRTAYVRITGLKTKAFIAIFKGVQSPTEIRNVPFKKSSPLEDEPVRIRFAGSIHEELV